MLKAESEIMDKEQTIIIINNIASLYLFPCFDHTGSISQDVYVFVFMVLVDFWTRLKQWLHEQVQECRNPDLRQA